MINIDQLIQALTDMQDKVIGLFHPKFYPPGEYICVVSDKDGMLECIEVGKLLGVSTLCIEATQGRYIKFPDTRPAYDRVSPKPQTLSDMKKNPVSFQEWYKNTIG